MIQTLIELAHTIVQFVKDMGYVGIFIMTFIESTFVPLPAEITMIPAGYLVHEGEMNPWWVMISAIAGTLGGASLNYWLALKYGRRLLLRHPKLFMINEQKLAKIEHFFEEHGAISMLTGRLLPGVRHYISFPAGLARMNRKLFLLYTAIGGGLWMLILMGLGYFIGENEHLVKKYLFYIAWGLILGSALAVIVYLRVRKRRKQMPPLDPPAP